MLELLLLESLLLPASANGTSATKENGSRFLFPDSQYLGDCWSSRPLSNSSDALFILDGWDWD